MSITINSVINPVIIIILTVIIINSNFNMPNNRHRLQ